MIESVHASCLFDKVEVHPLKLVVKNLSLSSATRTSSVLFKVIRFENDLELLVVALSLREHGLMERTGGGNLG